MFCHITGQLCHFDLLPQISLETSENDFPLSWLESIDDRCNGSVVVLVREVDELTIDELLISDGLSIIYHNCFWVVVGKPLLTFFCVLFGEDEFNGFVIFLTIIAEGDAISLQLLKVLLRLFISTGSQSFIILHFPTPNIGGIFSPSLKISHRVERDDLSTSAANLQEGGDELLKESFSSEK